MWSYHFSISCNVFSNSVNLWNAWSLPKNCGLSGIIKTSPSENKYEKRRIYMRQMFRMVFNLVYISESLTRISAVRLTPSAVHTSPEDSSRRTDSFGTIRNFDNLNENHRKSFEFQHPMSSDIDWEVCLVYALLRYRTLLTPISTSLKTTRESAPVRVITMSFARIPESLSNKRLVSSLPRALSRLFLAGGGFVRDRFVVAKSPFPLTRWKRVGNGLRSSGEENQRDGG